MSTSERNKNNRKRVDSTQRFVLQGGDVSMQCTRGARNRPFRRLITCIGLSPWGPPGRQQQQRQQQQHSAARTGRTALTTPPFSLDAVNVQISRGHATVAGAREASEDESQADLIHTRSNNDNDDAGFPVARFREGTEFGTYYFRSQLRRHSYEQEKLAKARARNKAREPDTWKHIVHMLDKATPGGQDRHKRSRETVTLPVGVAAVFVPSTEVAILEIMQRTGCHVQMAAGYAVQGRSNAFTGIFLQGTSAQNTSALSILPQYVEVSSVETAETRSRLQKHELHREVTAGDAESDEAPLFWRADDEGERSIELDEASSDTNHLPPSGEGIVRSVWARERLKGGLQLQRRIQGASAVRTPVDFTAYVADLTSAPPQVSEPESPSPGAAQKRPLNDTIQELVSLFTDTKTAPLATTESIGRAFEFLVKHSNMASVRQILKVLDEEGRNVGPRGYNALLAGAADTGDIHNFEHVLKSMLRRGETPNATTWAILHGYLCRFVPHEAESCAELMRTKGLFADNGSLRIIVKDTIKPAFTAYIKREGTAAGFLEAFDERVSSRYGRPDFNWFVVDVLNRMLDVLVALGRMQEAVTLLKDFRRRGTGAVETSTLNAFLGLTAHSYDLPAAIATLRLFRVGDPGAVVPNQATYRMLFDIAWRCRSYNLLRIVWRYACVAQAVDSKMRHRMGVSLLADASTPADKLSRGALFRIWAGKFAIGVTRDLIQGPHLPYDTSPKRHLTADEQRLVALASQHSLDPGSSNHRGRRQQLGRLLHDDVAEAGSCKPMLPMIPVFERAWHKDLQWYRRDIGPRVKQGRFYLGRDVFEEMLLHAIRVPMTAGDFTIRRKWEIPWLFQQGKTKADDAVDVKSGTGSCG